jgi:hypothetical protein
MVKFVPLGGLWQLGWLNKPRALAKAPVYKKNEKGKWKFVHHVPLIRGIRGGVVENT